MRTREETLAAWKALPEGCSDEQKVFLEVLLDIRDLLEISEQHLQILRNQRYGG